MKIVLSRSDIINPLKRVVGVIERRQTLPILSNVLLRSEGGVLSFTGTDLEVELVARLPIDDMAVMGKSTLPARKLMDICRNLSDSTDITLSFEKTQAVLIWGRSRFTLATLPAEDFPSIDEGPIDTELSIPSAALRFLLDRTAFAMAQQDVRYFLNGLLLALEDGHLTAVATDGHRLALAKVPLAIEGDERKVILPRKGVLELQRLLVDCEDEVILALGNNHLRASTQNFTLTSKLIDGHFPDFQRVIPRGGNKTVYVERSAFREMLSRAAILSSEKLHGVRVQLRPGLLRILASNTEQEAVEDEIEASYQGADDLDIAFNVNYLLDVSNCIPSKQIKVVLSDSNSSALVEEVPEEEEDDASSSLGETLYVVMPMRL
ncbi:MAG: DNA polymerase III subunit beta [Gammaproteobacteria bacterium]